MLASRGAPPEDKRNVSRRSGKHTDVFAPTPRCSPAPDDDDGGSGNEDQLFHADKAPIYPGCPLNIMESALLLLECAISEKLTGTALTRVLELIQMHLPDETEYFKNIKQLKKYFKNVDEHEIHYYCSNCFCLIQESVLLCCQKCSETDGTVISCLFPYLNKSKGSFKMRNSTSCCNIVFNGKAMTSLFLMCTMVWCTKNYLKMMGH